MYYNPLDKFYKSKLGPICETDKITFRIKGDFNKCYLIVKKDDENFYSSYEMLKVNDYFEHETSFNVGLYWYYFDLCDGRYISVGNDLLGQISDQPKSFQLSVFSNDYDVPSWLNGGIIYQIFPDRFNRGEKDKKVGDGKVLHYDFNDCPIYSPDYRGQVLNNDFFGGDFKGIIQKLEYLKSLNVTAIYLNPIFKAYSNHRYDTGDYMQIDSLLGTEEDFVELIKKAEELGIAIILDGVFNHTGDDSIYFNKYNNYDSVGAYQSQNSPYRNWYKFIDYPTKYESWWGITTLPALDKNNEEYLNFITGENGVLQKYIKLGIKGWRLDVVDELPEKFVRKIREGVKKAKKDAIIIGEVWEDASNKIAYSVRRKYFLGGELDSVMNYPLKNAILNYVKYKDVNRLSITVKEQLDHYPKKVLDTLMNILSTHDTSRLLSELSNYNANGKTKDELRDVVIPQEEYSECVERLKVATLLQYTLCGVPSVYYGDEAGMQGYKDPLNRRFYPWGKEDNEILSWYKFLGGLRKDFSAFSKGHFEEIFAKDGLFAFKRFDEYSQLAIITNVADKTHVVEFNGTLLNLIDNKEYSDKIILTKNQCAVLIKV